MKIGIGWYNGWSPQERLATLPIQKAAIASGKLARPTQCSICLVQGNRNWKADDAVWLHDENYAEPLAAYPICRRCHRILHRRFDHPAPWLALVAEHARGGRGSSSLVWTRDASGNRSAALIRTDCRATEAPRSATKAPIVNLTFTQPPQWLLPQRDRHYLALALNNDCQHVSFAGCASRAEAVDRT